MTWDDIGCDFGEPLTVVTKSGKTYSGVLVDFEIDFDGSYGGDSISLATDDFPSISFREDEIESIMAFWSSDKLTGSQTLVDLHDHVPAVLEQ